MAESKEIEMLCNNLRCRAVLSSLGEAVVTNCSHIFCAPCANSLIAADRICPACRSHLPGEDEITSLAMRPSTEWKASVLSGLSPAVILEIAQRAMSFWTYQTSQLSAFQDYVVGQAKERVHSLEAQSHKAEETNQAQERETLKLREQVDIQKSQIYKMAEELKTVKHELDKVMNQKRQLLLKQPLGNAMDLREAVNDQFTGGYESEQEVESQLMGNYGNANTNRAPFVATPRHTTRPAIPLPSGSRRSDPGANIPQGFPSRQRPKETVELSGDASTSFGRTAQPQRHLTHGNGFGTGTPRQTNQGGGNLPGQGTMTGLHDTLADMQRRAGNRMAAGGGRPSNGGIMGNNMGGGGGGTFGVNGNVSGMGLRNVNAHQQRRYAM